MKNMKKFVAAFAVGAVLSVLSGTAALAGQKGTPMFYLIKNADGSGSVQGHQASIRNTSDTFSYFGVTVYNYASGAGTRYGFIQGRDPNNAYFSCYTYDNGLLEILSRVQGDEFLYVTWDASARCTMVQTSYGSQLAPKTP